MLDIDTPDDLAALSATLDGLDGRAPGPVAPCARSLVGTVPTGRTRLPLIP